MTGADIKRRRDDRVRCAAAVAVEMLHNKIAHGKVGEVYSRELAEATGESVPLAAEALALLEAEGRATSRLDDQHRWLRRYYKLTENA